MQRFQMPFDSILKSICLYNYDEYIPTVTPGVLGPSVAVPIGPLPREDENKSNRPPMNRDSSPGTADF